MSKFEESLINATTVGDNLQGPNLNVYPLREADWNIYDFEESSAVLMDLDHSILRVPLTAKIEFAIQIEIAISAGLRVAESLTYHKIVEEVDFPDNEIIAAGIEAFDGVLQINTALKTPNLGGNAIGDEGAKCLSDVLLEIRSIQKHHLNSNNISDEVANATPDLLKKNRIKCLLWFNFCMNDIGDERAKLITDARRQNCTSSTIEGVGNNIHSEGAKDLCDVLNFNGKIETLKLSWCLIGAADAEFNTMLTTLDSPLVLDCIEILSRVPKILIVSEQEVNQNTNLPTGAIALHRINYVLKMMSNSDILKLASESMKNRRIEVIKRADEHLKQTRTEEMVEIMNKITEAKAGRLHATSSNPGFQNREEQI